MATQLPEDSLRVETAEAALCISHGAHTALKRGANETTRHSQCPRPVIIQGVGLSLTPDFSWVQKAWWAIKNCFNSLDPVLRGQVANQSVAIAAVISSFIIFTSNSFAGVKTGETFPDLSTFKLEGKLPETTKGKVIMVDFWASWCEPCKQSFPVMEDLQQRYGKEGLVIIAVNVDENRADMEAFLKKNAVTFVVIRDPNQKLVERAGVATMPSSFLIDREGKVRFLHNGYRGAETKKKYDEEIQSLLKK